MRSVSRSLVQCDDLIKKRRVDTGTAMQTGECLPPGRRGLGEVPISQGSPRLQQSPREEAGGSLAQPRGISPPDSLTLDFGFHTGNTVELFKPPGVWQFVTAAPATEYMHLSEGSDQETEQIPQASVYPGIGTLSL